eukprot:8483950-Heterocapsa_arctica.AAC.1
MGGGGGASRSPPSAPPGAGASAAAGSVGAGPPVARELQVAQYNAKPVMQGFSLESQSCRVSA